MHTAIYIYASFKNRLSIETIRPVHPLFDLCVVGVTFSELNFIAFCLDTWCQWSYRRHIFLVVVVNWTFEWMLTLCYGECLTTIAISRKWGDVIETCGRTREMELLYRYRIQPNRYLSLIKIWTAIWVFAVPRPLYWKQNVDCIPTTYLYIYTVLYILFYSSVHCAWHRCVRSGWNIENMKRYEWAQQTAK